MKLGIYYDESESSQAVAMGESAVAQPLTSDQIAVEDSEDMNND